MPEITPSPIMHIAIGGLVGGLLGAPLITNPFDTLTPPNPIGYLLVLVGLPLGGLVYRIRSLGCQVDSESRRLSYVGVGFTAMIPLVMAMIVGTSSDKGLGFIGIAMIVAVSLSCSILAIGVRRPSKGQSDSIGAERRSDGIDV